MAGSARRTDGSLLSEPYANEPIERLELVPISINGYAPLALPPETMERQEPERLASMRELLEPGMVLFDVGAETGVLSALLASWVAGMLPDGRPCTFVGEAPTRPLTPPPDVPGGVVLIEPSPHVWPNIRLLFAANALPVPLGCFVGFASHLTDEQPPLLDFDPGVIRGGWPLVADGPAIRAHGFRSMVGQDVSTPQIRLDDLVGRFDVWPDAITIDVEGAELNVLHGAHGLLREHHPLVWCSVHRRMMEDFDATAEQLLDFMDDCRYAGEHLATDHEEHWIFVPRPS